MTTSTPRLGLLRHTTADTFDIADYAANWASLEAHPGILVATAITMPVWGPNQAGLILYQSDNKILLAWDGTAFFQIRGRGLLGQTVRSTDFSTTSLTYVVAVQTSVVALNNARSLMLIIEAPKVINTVGVAGLAICAGSTPLIEFTSGTNASPANRPAAYTFVTPPPAAGTIVYSLQVRADPAYLGTTSVLAHCSITVVEV